MIETVLGGRFCCSVSVCTAEANVANVSLATGPVTLVTYGFDDLLLFAAILPLNSDVMCRCVRLNISYQKHLVIYLKQVKKKKIKNTTQFKST